MDTLAELKRVMEINDKLVACNSELVAVNAKCFELVAGRLHKEEKLLKQCGKVCDFLQSKAHKTWEEKKLMEELYVLITHTEV